MRKILFAFLGLCALSCSSDDDSNTDTTPAIVGTWVISEFNVENDSFDLNNDGVESSDLIAETGCYQGESIVFNADGTGSVTYTTDLDLTLTNQNNVETFSYVCEEDNFIFNFTWTQSANGSFVASAGGEDVIFTLPSNNVLVRPSFFEYEIVFLDANGDVSSTTFSDSDATNVFVKQ
ncbi:lipocalin family protein [Olleya sp. YS]|uniref:lipocalin family protein n=1 Tax=Olleya sp. YS TaxID=3028318 RepID=UPI00243435BE|nr:lipocalin family protein [Olleya sp. YS]WGD35470.1 lipocalin family protein [Olleya sp. YS]